ncbi:MAG: tyrosine-protein phosphatase [Defluviitaleaceae bacterium]|nr:tyrosine-protein phosphatase [Defluviitaleaceae bacterium]
MNLTNFRDLGNIKTKNGQTIKKGLLLRGQVLHNLSIEDKINLEHLKISKIIDLRRDAELELVPSDTLEGVEYKNINLMEDLFDGFTYMKDKMDTLNEETAHEQMLNFYTLLVQAGDKYKKFFDEVLSAEGPIFFHCTHGKDRTGITATILLKILGVSDEDIYKDYLKTIEARKEAIIIELEEFKEKGYTEDQIKGLATAFSVRRDYLECFLSLIEEKHGSFENFIKNIGITEKDIKKLKEKFLN